MSDSAVGPWINAGVKYNPIKQLNIGADLRYSYAKIEDDGSKSQAGGYHWGIFAGWGF